MIERQITALSVLRFSIESGWLVTLSDVVVVDEMGDGKDSLLVRISVYQADTQPAQPNWPPHGIKIKRGLRGIS